MDLLGFCTLETILYCCLLFSVLFFLFSFLYIYTNTYTYIHVRMGTNSVFGSAPSSHVASACNPAWIKLAPSKFNFIVVYFFFFCICFWFILVFLGLSRNQLGLNRKTEIACTYACVWVCVCVYCCVLLCLPVCVAVCEHVKPCVSLLSLRPYRLVFVHVYVSVYDYVRAPGRWWGVGICMEFINENNCMSLNFSFLIDWKIRQANLEIICDSWRMVLCLLVNKSKISSLWLRCQIGKETKKK